MAILPKLRPKADDAKGALRWAALFLGELRDGLTMVRQRALNRVWKEGNAGPCTSSDTLVLLFADQYAKRLSDCV